MVCSASVHTAISQKNAASSALLRRHRARSRALALLLLCAAYGHVAAGQATSTRPPLPESILTESATDIDAPEAGELEYEFNLGLLRSHAGGARSLTSSVEVEWRALDNFGLRLEPTFARDRYAGFESPHSFWGVSSALAFGLLHDFAHDFHLQAEVLARTASSDSPHALEPAETQLPVGIDLLMARRVGGITFRATAGAEAGGTYAHAPIHTDAAALMGFAREERFGFVALDVRSDWARSAPLVVAPEVVSDLSPVGIPLRLGVALPVNVATAANSTYGLFIRIIWLTEREAQFGRSH